MTPPRTPILSNTSILIDTNIWIEHFKSENKDVSALLEAGRVVMHPFIVAELALGGLRDRMMTLASLEFLPELPVAELHEVRQLIEVRKLFTQGIGLVDAHLIASLIIVESPSAVWTDDEGLAVVADKLSFLAKPPFAGRRFSK
jgi:predicted nucleic acid-binding protein